MTSPAASRCIAAFAVPSEPGSERLALARVAEAVAGLGITGARLERLKTAVAEATMNAIEHGNGNRPEVPVDVEVVQAADEIVVAISDSGGPAGSTGTSAAGDSAGAGTAGRAPLAAGQSTPQEPDLGLKLAGAQSPRGWGLFLIRSMVDAMQITTEGTRHTVWLTMRTMPPAAEGASDGEQL